MNAENLLAGHCGGGDVVINRTFHHRQIFDDRRLSTTVRTVDDDRRLEVRRDYFHHRLGPTRLGPVFWPLRTPI